MNGIKSTNRALFYSLVLMSLSGLALASLIWLKMTIKEPDYVLIEPGHESEVYSTVWNNDRTLFATSGSTIQGNSQIRIWNTTREIVTELNIEVYDAFRLAWHPTENILAICTLNDEIFLWDIQESDIVSFGNVNECHQRFRWESVDTLVASQTDLLLFEFSRLFSYNFNNEGLPFVWDVNNNDIATYESGRFRISAIGSSDFYVDIPVSRTIIDLDWSPQGSYIAIIYEDSDLEIFDVSTEDYVLSFSSEESFRETITTVEWSNDEALLAVLVGAGNLNCAHLCKLYVIDLSTTEIYEIYTILQELDIDYSSVQWHSSNKFIAMNLSPDPRRLEGWSSIFVIDTSTGEVVRQLRHDPVATSFTWTHDFRGILTGSRDGSLRLWPVILDT